MRKWKTEVTPCGCIPRLNWISSSFKCKGQCADRRYQCKKEGRPCTAQCHTASGHHPCNNAEYQSWASRAGGFEQAELFLCVYKTIDLIYSRSAFIHMSGLHIYAIPERPCNSGMALNTIWYQASHVLLLPKIQISSFTSTCKINFYTIAYNNLLDPSSAIKEDIWTYHQWRSSGMDGAHLDYGTWRCEAGASGGGEVSWEQGIRK